MTNLEWLIAALTLQFDDAYAEQECAIHYNIKCPYYSGKHPCDDAEPSRELCVPCKQAWLEEEYA